MIVVKIELWPGGWESKKKEIGRMTIANRGINPAHPKRGDYRVRIMRRGTTDVIQRESEVLNYPRQSYPVWELIMRALNSSFGKVT